MEERKGRVVKEHVCIKDTWTKPNVSRSEEGRWGWVEQGKVVAGK